MNKTHTDFTTSPNLWLRASRVSQTAADYASPPTRYSVENAGHRAVLAISIVGCAAIVVLLATGVML